jgi:hypothetical protein
LTTQAQAVDRDDTLYVDDADLHLELRPFSISTAEAFLQGRGFTPEQATAIAKSACIHKLEIHNKAASNDKPAITANLNHWSVRSVAGVHPPITRDKWHDRLNRDNLSKPARIAFGWALFPTEQIFWPGDYNWGLIAFGLKTKTQFTLEIKWQVGQKNREKIIKNLRCSQ